MILGDLIKEYRKKHHYSMDEFSKRCGLSKAYISILERNLNPVNQKEVVPSLETIKAVSTAIGMDVNEVIALLDGSQPISLVSDTKLQNRNLIPVLGKVQAGIPMNAVEYIIDYEEISDEMARLGEYFALQVKGDSMEPKISDGDVVIVLKQADATSGDIVIALVNGDEATIKKLQKFDGGINLIPSNPNYDVLTYSKEQIQKLPVEILGKVVELRAKF